MLLFMYTIYYRFNPLILCTSTEKSPINCKILLLMSFIAPYEVILRIVQVFPS